MNTKTDVAVTKGIAVRQCKRILEHLEKGEILTRLTAWQELGIMNPTARISELRSKGFDIKTKMVEVKNRWNEKCKVAEWKL